MEINFNTNIVQPKFSDNILNLLPTVNNTVMNQMFFDSSLNELFKKGSGVKINGYIGKKLNWYDRYSDLYINEISDERNFYQLEPTMTVKINNQYINAVYFTDYVKNLQSNGALTSLQNRLFSEEYYTYSMPINYDMFFNYMNYYCLTTVDTDYILISSSDTKNPWNNSIWVNKKDITDISLYQQATRPIICFNNIKMYDYGEYRRQDVNIINTDISDLTDIQQKANISINGKSYNKFTLPNGKISVLFTSLKAASENNIIYDIYFDFSGLSVFEIKTDGLDISGKPNDGEIFLNLDDGNEYFYKNNAWNLAQKKTRINQPPLFMLYDENGNELSDTTTYPLSTFTGSKIFSYSEDPTQSYVKDTELNLFLNYDSSGSVLFENNIEKDQFYYNKTDLIDSVYFYGNVSVTNTISINLSTCWVDSGLSTQKLIETFTFNGDNRVFELSTSQFTDYTVYIRNTLDNDDNIITTKTLTENVDYLIDNNELLVKNIDIGDEVYIEYSSTNFINSDHYYEYPLSINCNAAFDKIENISYKDLTFFYKNSTYPKKSSASMLLEMLLSSSDKTDILTSIQFCADQYRIYMFKFISKLTEFCNTGLYNSSDDTDTIVNDILSFITKGLTPNSTFYNSGVGVSNTYVQDFFIPPTPSFLGLYKVYEPSISIDYTTPNKLSNIICHDGSYIPAYGDFRDDVILNLQNRIYMSIEDSFKVSPVMDIDQYVSNAFHTNEYSYAEYCSIMEQFFNSWCYSNNLDYKNNTTYDQSNPFTYNWSSMVTWATNTNLLGGWRGIYNYMYGTDKPHIAPWECLGFSIKPSYWDDVYGPAPYTSGNKKLWGDINDGIIDEKGTVDKSRTRYNMIYYIPVDEQGNLCDPIGANLLAQSPNYDSASNSWEFGDGSPIETVWKRSSDYPFAVLSTLYLMKPSTFITKCWDTLKTKNKTQLVYDRNKSYSDMYIHLEEYNNSVVYNYGIQQFISYNIKGNSESVTSIIGNNIRGLGVNLAHRIGGFTNESSLTLTSDTYGVLPDENYSIIAYNSPINDVIQYSALLIVKEDAGWKIYGYDQVSSGFKTLQPNTNSIGFDIEVSNVSEFRTTYWTKNTKYIKGQIISYDAVSYECAKNHTSGQFFEIGYWSQVSDNMFNINSVEWFTKYKSTDVVSIPFGSYYSSYQDVSNLMCGIELYHTYSGISFEQENNSKWYDCIEQFIKWDFTASKNDFIVLSPLSNNVTMDLNFGNVLNVEDIRNGKWSIIDINNKNTNDFDVIRTSSTISIYSTNNVICGCNFYKNTIEHMLILDNTTIFDDIIYSPNINIRQKRIHIDGYKTDNWNGRMSAGGFLISGNTIIPNFDTCADNFRFIYETDSVEYDNLQKRGRANIGFYESDTLANLMIGTSNQFEVYQSVIQNKGTASAFNRLLRSSILSSYEDISFYEEWAFRVGEYGSQSNFQSLDMFIRQKDIKSDNQVITFKSEEIMGSDSATFMCARETVNFNIQSQLSSSDPVSGTIKSVSIKLIENIENSNTTVYINDSLVFGPLVEDLIGGILIDLSDKNIKYDNTTKITLSSEAIFYATVVIDFDISTVSKDENTIEIIDYIDSNTNLILQNDSDWYLRQFDGNQINFKKKQYNLNNKKFLNTAGYVNLDTVDWKATNEQAFKSLYQTAYNNIGVTTYSPSYDFVLNSSCKFPVLNKMLSSVSDGYFRINKITLTITSVFQLSTVINVGTLSQLPDGIVNNYSANVIERFTYDKLQNVGTYEVYPSEILYMNGSDNDLYIQVCCDQTSIPENIDLGEFNIQFDIEYVSNDNIKPNDRVWVYNIDNSWNTYKLIDTGLKIYDVSPNISGTPVLALETGSDISQIKSISKNIVLSGMSNGNMDLNNLDPVFNNSKSVLVNGANTQTPLYTMNVNAGMKINTFTINVLRPFSTTDGSDLDFQIGDIDNANYIADSYVISNPAPTSPVLSSVNPITVQAYNKTITILNGTPVIDVYVTRSGNIFGKVDANGNIINPTECGNTVTTSFSWNLYSVDSSNNIGTTSLDSGTFSFLNPDTASDVTSDPDYWMATILVTIPSNGNYAFVISSVSGGTISQSTTIIEMSGSSTSYNLFDPTRIGLQNIDPTQFNNDSNNGVIYATIGSNTIGSAIISISYEYDNGFELGGNITQSGNTFTVSNNVDDTTNYIRNSTNGRIIDSNNNQIDINDSYVYDSTYVVDSSYVYGGNVFAWIPTRFKSIDQFNLVKTNYISGDYIEIDNSGNWNICKYDGNSLNVVISKSDMVDTDLIQSAYLYNVDTKIIEQYLDIYDPLKGYIPGEIRKEIDIISNNNPAIYNISNFSNVNVDNDNSWDDTKVGMIWWNTRSSPYLVYEMTDISGTNEYKIKNWGKMCPGIDVDVYQWIKSPVSPSEFESYVNSNVRYDGFDNNPSGTIDSEMSYSWVEKVEWNNITNSENTVYFFWAKNCTTSYGMNKDMTAYEISYELQNKSGIPTFSVIDNNQVIISGSKDFITDDNTTLKINWKLKDSDTNFHKEWTLLSENNSTIPDCLWNKMCSSLIGYDFKSQSKTFQTVLIKDFMPTDTVAYIDSTDETLNSLPINADVKIGNTWYTYGNVIGSKITGITQSRPVYSKNTQVEFIWNDEIIINVPDRSLNEYEQIGSSLRPVQSWVKMENGISSRSIRKIFVKYMNEYFTKNKVVDNWNTNFSFFTSEDEKPLSVSYVDTIDNISDLLTYSISNDINYNDCILVTGSDSYDFWSLWCYQPFATSENGGFNLINFQKWRLQESELWEYADWYADGYSEKNYPTYIFKNITERDSYKNDIDVTLLYGTLVMVQEVNPLDKRWAWYSYDGSSWTEVAKQNGTIKLSDSFYNNSYVHGIDKFNKNMISFRDGTYELYYILNELRNNIFTDIEENNLFFEIVKFAISQTYQNDWVFKTSLLEVGGYVEEFNQRAVSVTDKLQYIEDFINEYKPYHVKIKDFVYGYTNGVQDTNVHITDFDYPQYYDAKTKEMRNLYPYLENASSNNTSSTLNNNVIVDGDSSIVYNNYPWKDWYDNFTNTQNFVDVLHPYTENWNPIKKIETSLIFDRKQTYSNKGWDTSSWDTKAVFINSYVLSKNMFWQIDNDIMEYSNFVTEKENQFFNFRFGQRAYFDNGAIIKYNISGPTGFASETVNLTMYVSPTMLTSEDYNIFRPDIYGGYVHDRSVASYRDLILLGLDPNIIDGTVCFVENEQTHYIMVKKLLYKLLNRFSNVTTTQSDHWIIGDLPIIDKSGYATMNGVFKDISYIENCNFTWIPSKDKFPDDNFYDDQFIQNTSGGLDFVWLPYVSQGWDAPFYQFDGAAARIENYYSPEAGMISKEDALDNLSGVEYGDNIISGGDFSTDDYDFNIVPIQLETNGIPYDSDTSFSGGEIGNPYTGNINPEEYCGILIRDSLVIDIFENSAPEPSSTILAYKFYKDMNDKFFAYDFASIISNYSENSEVVNTSQHVSNLTDVFETLYGLYYSKTYNVQGGPSTGWSYSFTNEIKNIQNGSGNIYGMYMKLRGLDVDQLFMIIPNIKSGFVSISDPTKVIAEEKAALPFLNEDNFDYFYDSGLLDNRVLTLGIVNKEDIESGLDAVQKNQIKKELLSSYNLWYGDELISFNDYEDITDSLMPNISDFKLADYDPTDEVQKTNYENAAIEKVFSIYRLKNVVRSIGGGMNYTAYNMIYYMQYQRSLLQDVLLSISNLGVNDLTNNNVYNEIINGQKLDENGRGAVNISTIGNNALMLGDANTYNMSYVETHNIFDSKVSYVEADKINFISVDSSSYSSHYSNIMEMNPYPSKTDVTVTKAFYGTIPLYNLTDDMEKYYTSN